VIKLDRYNANRAPLFNAFDARFFRLAMFSFSKLTRKEREEERLMERRIILGSIIKSICPISNDAVSTTILFTFFYHNSEQMFK